MRDCKKDFADNEKYEYYFKQLFEKEIGGTCNWLRINSEADFFVERKGKSFKLELKTDHKHTDNFFLEIKSVRADGSIALGCVHQAVKYEAENFAYWFESKGNKNHYNHVYFFKTEELADWLDQNCHNYYHVPIKNKCQYTGKTFETFGIIVPVETLRKENIFFKDFTFQSDLSTLLDKEACTSGL